LIAFEPKFIRICASRVRSARTGRRSAGTCSAKSSPAPAAEGDATRALERADIASARSVGTHNCTGQCSDTGGLCTQDSDCGGSSCGAIECDELQWRVAWRPWDADTTFQVPTVPSGFTPTGYALGPAQSE